MAPGHDRRADDNRLDELARRVEVIESQIAANTMLTEAVKQDTAELVAFFKAAQGAVRFGRMLGGAAKWLTQLAAAAVVLWVVFRYGVAEALRDLWSGHK